MESGWCTGRIRSLDFYRLLSIRFGIPCYPVLLHGTLPHSHSIILDDGNALTFFMQNFSADGLNPTDDPSNFFALEFKGKIRRFEFSAASTSIANDRSIFRVVDRGHILRPDKKRPSAPYRFFGDTRTLAPRQTSCRLCEGPRAAQ